MSAAEKIAPAMSEPMTWAEICGQYPNEWVCLVEIDDGAPGATTITSARVLGHGKTRRDSLASVGGWWTTYQGVHLFFTGSIQRPLLSPRIEVTHES